MRYLNKIDEVGSIIRKGIRHSPRHSTLGEMSVWSKFTRGKRNELKPIHLETLSNRMGRTSSSNVNLFPKHMPFGKAEAKRISDPRRSSRRNLRNLRRILKSRGIIE